MGGEAPVNPGLTLRDAPDGAPQGEPDACGLERPERRDRRETLSLPGGSVDWPPPCTDGKEQEACDPDVDGSIELRGHGASDPPPHALTREHAVMKGEQSKQRYVERNSGNSVFARCCGAEARQVRDEEIGKRGEEEKRARRAEETREARG